MRGSSHDPSFGVPSIMIYQLKRGHPTYPQIISDDVKRLADPGVGTVRYGRRFGPS